MPTSNERARRAQRAARPGRNNVSPYGSVNGVRRPFRMGLYPRSSETIHTPRSRRWSMVCGRRQARSVGRYIFLSLHVSPRPRRLPVALRRGVYAGQRLRSVHLLPPLKLRRAVSRPKLRPSANRPAGRVGRRRVQWPHQRP